MVSVEEIKTAIANLSLSERAQLERWLHGWEDDDWDHQIANDASDGRLDDILSKVDSQIDAGDLREFLRIAPSDPPAASAS